MNLKKTICIMMCAAIVYTLAGCGNGVDTRAVNTQTSVSDVLESNTQAQNEGARNNNAASALNLKEDAGLGTIDVDLTALSSTMVYSEVFNITSSPAEYIGKIVKMAGQCTTFHDNETGNDYYACFISDAAACCAQGIEFVLTEDYAMPDDYPQEGDEITVVGVFDTYMENGYEYSTLRNASLVV